MTEVTFSDTATGIELPPSEELGAVAEAPLGVELSSIAAPSPIAELPHVAEPPPGLPPGVEMPPGVALQQSVGAITGKPMFRISGFEMPWRSSPLDALNTYNSLKRAFDSGFFNGGVQKTKNEAAAAAAANSNIKPEAA